MQNHLSKTPAEIVEASAPILGVTVEEIFSQSRKRDISDVRRMIAGKLESLDQFSLSQIVRALGRTDHTSAMHWRDTHKDYMQFNLDYREQYNAYNQILEL